MDFIRKNLEHFFNFLKYISERLLCIIVILFIIIIATIFFFRNSVIINPSSFESQEILFCGISLGNLSAWFGGIAIIITAIWSMYQFVKSRTIKQQEKASVIAQDFADNIIERMGMISDVLLANGEVKILLNKIDSLKLKQFTQIEMLDILGKSDCFTTFEKIITSKSTQKRYNKILETRYTQKEREKFD